MDWLADRVDSLAKQAAEVSLYDVRAAVNKAKAYALNLTEYEQKVREATDNEAWGASSTLMQDIAQAQLFNEIMPTIYSRFTEKEARQWRQIYKGLVLLEYLIKNGSERVVDDARSHLSLIRVLRSFHYIDENGKDQGINVRNRAKELGELLSDLDRVRLERRKAKANRNKYTGVGNDSLGGGQSLGGGSGSRYGGFGSDSFHGDGAPGYSGGTGLLFAEHASPGLTAHFAGSGGFSGGFQDSRGSNTNDFEEYDAGEDEERAVHGSSASAPAPSRGSSARTAATTKPTPAPPKAAPQPEVNLFDFDDDEQQPTPPPKFSTTVPSISTAPSAALDDDFDDFQSAGPIAAASSATASAPAPLRAQQNVFDLLGTQAAPRPSTQPAPAPALSGRPATSQAFPPPLQARPALQPHSSSFASPTHAAGIATSSTPAAAKTPASDFSDLFDVFGASPASASQTAASGAGKQSMAQIAAQKRQDQLFSMSGGAKPPASGASGADDGWDSLL
ncbi:hypothetical protein JCM10207_005407 [Rhodosporidiobolus poonsookiae]